MRRIAREIVSAAALIASRRRFAQAITEEAVRRVFVLALVCALVFLSQAHPVFSGGPGGQTLAPPPAPDYADPASWSALPESGEPAKPVDVFFMHPTTYGTLEFGLNAPITDPAIRAATDGTVADQASAFADCCAVYAPRYRQVSIEVMRMDPEEKERHLAVAEADMLAAFTYYLEHDNKGRPFILAGHSQGSNVTELFLTRHRDLVPDDKLVAAYLPGWTFTAEGLAALGLPLAERPSQTGAIVTWNTVGKGGKSPTILPGALCVNPLTWTTDKAEAPASLDSYARITLNDGRTVRIEHFTPARINDAGGLEIPRPAIEDQLRMGLGEAIYHRYDYAFFYGNIAQNAKARCEAWLGAHGN